MNIMTELDLRDLLEKVTPMSFEEGKSYILAHFPNVTVWENTDFTSFTLIPHSKHHSKQNGVYDCDFLFVVDNAELMLSFTTSCTEGKEGDTIHYEDGYWHIHGQQYRATAKNEMDTERI